MHPSNKLQKALNSGSGLSFGAWQTLPGTNHSRTIARSGFDWVLVDTEHGNIDDAAMHEAVGALVNCGVSPIVRIAANEGWMVKRALDSGAHGIVVPLLRTEEEVRKVVAAAKFPPTGVRGFGSPFPMGSFGNQTAAEYLQQANDSLLTIIQIETKEALENVDAIAKVPGVDVLFAGPFDLGISLGHPITDGKMADELKEALARIQKSAAENGKKSAIYCVSGEEARRFADQGFQMISVIPDIGALSSALTSALSTAKGSYAHSALNFAKKGATSLAGRSEQ